MFKIRDEVAEALERAARSSLVDRIADQLRNGHALALGVIGEEKLRARIREGLVRAHGHGLRREASLTDFVILQFEVSPRFDEQPAIRKLLRDTEIPDQERVQALHRLLGPEAWDEAYATRSADPEFMADVTGD